MIYIMPDEFSTEDLELEEELVQSFLEVFYEHTPSHSSQDQVGAFASVVPSGFFIYVLHNDQTWTYFEVKISIGKRKWRTSDVQNLR